MILAAAQTKPGRADIKTNLPDHIRLTKLAAEQGADLIVFPEMSITGYQRDKARKLAFTENGSWPHAKKHSVTKLGIRISEKEEKDS